MCGGAYNDNFLSIILGYSVTVSGTEIVAATAHPFLMYLFILKKGELAKVERQVWTHSLSYPEAYCLLSFVGTSRASSLVFCLKQILDLQIISESPVPWYVEGRGSIDCTRITWHKPQIDPKGGPQNSATYKTHRENVSRCVPSASEEMKMSDSYLVDKWQRVLSDPLRLLRSYLTPHPTYLSRTINHDIVHFDLVNKGKKTFHFWVPIC